MSSTKDCDMEAIDLARDVLTTAEDIEALRRFRRETPSWLSLTPQELDALIPHDALDRRPAIRADASPFTLP